MFKLFLYADYLFKFSRGRVRIFLGKCPLCATRDPQVCFCAICYAYYSSAVRHQEQREDIKKTWWAKYIQVIEASCKLKGMLKDSELYRKSDRNK